MWIIFGASQTWVGLRIYDLKDHHAEYCSIVIATVGRASLLPLINSLLRSLKTIDFIVYVVFPTLADVDIWRSKLERHCVQVFAAGERKQVAQRAFGFRQCSGEIVVQLDDDLILGTKCIPTMLQLLNAIGRGNIVGALRKDRIQPTWAEVNHGDMRGVIINKIRDCYAFIIGGAVWGSDRRGSVTKRVAAYAPQWEPGLGDLVATDWLPGGCVACFREDLITEDFYPFNGKAYFEDLIHSHLRRGKGLNHWVSGLSVYEHPQIGNEQTFKDFVLEAARRVQVAGLLGLSPCGAAFYSVIELVKKAGARVAIFGYGWVNR